MYIERLVVELDGFVGAALKLLLPTMLLVTYSDGGADMVVFR